jgi:hypothetical protein
LTLVTRVPRPAKRSVAAAAGNCFHNFGSFRYGAVVHEPNAAGLEQAFKQPEACWSAFALPPLLDQLSKSPEIVYFVADSYLSCATGTRFGFVGSRNFETRDPRPHKALGSDLIILERVSE